MKREQTYATVCSGIECMSAACQDLPMRPVFFSEIEPFPCAVLKHRFPHVPNLGDMSKIHINEKGEITNGTSTVVLPPAGLDVLAGGTPCQDVSNAGKRRGMAEGSGTRSSLAFEFVRLIRELRPRYVVWENVAGVLTDESFPQFLRAIADCGYGVAYRTLDAQYVRCADIDLPDGGVVRLERAVPQRRRRVWAVGCAGADVGKASEVLFEPLGVCGDRPPRRVAGQGPARALVGRARVPDGVVGGAAASRGNGVGAKEGVAYTLDTVQPQGVAVSIATKQQAMTVTEECGATLEASCYKEPQGVAVASGFDPYEAGGVKTLNAGHAGTVVNNPLVVETFVKVSHAHGRDGAGERWDRGECAGTRNAIEGGDGRSQECVVEARGPSCGEGASPSRVVTNSNGADVCPTLSRDCRSTGKQIEKNGGYVLERREPLATHNFECYDNAQGVSVTLGAKRAHDTFAVEGPLGFKCNPSEKTRGIGDEVEVTPRLSSSSCDASVAFGIRQGKPGGGKGALLSEERALCVGAGAEQSVLIPDVASMRYVVRRLTPTECERLMGLPDGWTLPAFQPVEITDRLVDEFRRIHDTFGAVMAGYAGKPPPKPKTDAWVRKWLERIADPATCPDAPRYKACGNGMCTNQVRWIFLRILASEGIDPWKDAQQTYLN